MGFWAESFFASGFWASNFWSGTAISPQPEQQHGGGGGFKTERRKALRKPEGNVREWLLEAFAEMEQEGASPEVVAQVKHALQGHRKPNAVVVPRYELPPISSIDLQALLRDIETLAVIELAYQQFLAEEEEDEDMLLMMGF